MPISFTAMTSGSGVATSLTTASKTPTANTLQLLAVWNQDATPDEDPVNPTVTGCDLTWVSVATQEMCPYAALTTCARVTIFRALGAAPATGALTISFGGVSSYGTYSWVEVPGTKITGANGADAIVQSAGNFLAASGTSLTATLGAFANPLNGIFAMFGNTFPSGGSATVGSGFTLVHTLTRAGYGDGLSQTKVGQDTTVDSSIASSSYMGGLAVEIAVLPSDLPSNATVVTGLARTAGTTLIGALVAACVGIGRALTGLAI